MARRQWKTQRMEGRKEKVGMWESKKRGRVEEDG